MKAVGIKWDTDNDKALEEQLPKEMVIPEAVEKQGHDAISDYLSDVTGFCHFGFNLAK